MLAPLAVLVLAVPAHASQRAPWPRIPWPPHVVVHEGDCPVEQPAGVGPIFGCAVDGGDVWVTAVDWRFGVLHEVGHVYDEEVLVDADRARLTWLFHLTGPWVQGTGLIGLRSPNEWSADLYARCRMHQSAQSRRQDVNYTGTWPRARTLRVCAVFAAAGERAGLG